MNRIGVGLLLAVGCSNGTVSSNVAPDAATADVAALADETSTADTDGGLTNYHEHVAPILNARCATCHTEGESTPMPLDTFASAKTYAGAAVAAMEVGKMPPWQPDPSCRHYDGERILQPGELDTVRAWIADGLPEGTPPAVSDAPPSTNAFVPTEVGKSPEPYTPSGTTVDDWRCFILDTTFERDVYLTGIRVVPDQKALVHHVLVYAVSGTQRATLDKGDADDPGAGFECFGGPNPGGDTASPSGGFDISQGFPNQIGAWVPGSNAGAFPEGQGIRIAKDSIIVMQVHYNLLAATPAPDQSTLELQLTETEPDYLLRTLPLAIRSLNIAAGNADDTYSVSFGNWGSKPFQIERVSAHMHMLGTTFGVEHELPTAEGTECLLRIDDWDFNWQQSYRFRDGERVTVAPGDAIRLSCGYDNSQANQPVVNGAQIEPRDVTWGEGSLDEMCLTYITTIAPFAPAPSPSTTQCPGANSCFASCAGNSDLDCLLSCPTVDLTCGSCLLKGSAKCGVQCVAPLATDEDAKRCVSNCGVATLAMGGNLGVCMAASCPAIYKAVVDCLGPIVQSGACDDVLAGCGVARPAE